MFCSLCVSASKSNVFVTGCSNFRTSNLERHVLHGDHKASVITKPMEDKVSNLEKSLCSRKKKKESFLRWKLSPGSVKKAFPLVLQLCWPFLNLWILHTFKNYIVLKTQQTSHIIANEMQEAIVPTMTKVINKELQDSPCIDILVDKSTDLSLIKLLVIYAQMIKVL